MFSELELAEKLSALVPPPQKNGSLVRAYLHDLYDFTPEHVRMLNELYADTRIYCNFLQPVLFGRGHTGVIQVLVPFVPPCYSCPASGVQSPFIMSQPRSWANLGWP